MNIAVEVFEFSIMLPEPVLSFQLLLTEVKIIDPPFKQILFRLLPLASNVPLICR